MKMIFRKWHFVFGIMRPVRLFATDNLDSDRRKSKAREGLVSSAGRAHGNPLGLALASKDLDVPLVDVNPKAVEITIMPEADTPCLSKSRITERGG